MVDILPYFIKKVNVSSLLLHQFFEDFAWDLNSAFCSAFFKLLLTFLLLFPKFLFSRNISAVEVAGYILFKRWDCFSRDNAAFVSCLNCLSKLEAWEEVFKALGCSSSFSLKIFFWKNSS